MAEERTQVVWLEECRRADVATVGGKNASLGGMLSSLTGEGMSVPPGFATTASAFRQFLAHYGLQGLIDDWLARFEDGRATLAKTGSANGLVRGEDGLEVFVMCEIPSNVVLADAFAQRFDGFSIGLNDLTQLTLGVDRGSEALAALFDEGDAAVKWMIAQGIESAHRANAVVGLCGQAPSDDPQFAAFLVAEGIDSISVTPDSFFAVKSVVARAQTNEAPMLRQAGSQ